MKAIYKYIAVVVLALGFASCDDWMASVPEGATMTAEQASEVAQKNPSTSASELNAIYAQFIQLYPGLGEDYGRHNDFGYAAICMFMEAQGQDFVSQAIGYNWFSYSDWRSNRDNTMTTSQGYTCNIVWNEYYKIINACNNVIGLVDRENPGSQVAVLSQALAVRAFVYFQLAQIYQFPYDDATLDKPCVPLVLENMPAEKLSNNPRVTVAEVYTLIKEDLDYAVENLEGFVRPDKGYVNQAVALGLRARVNLVLKNYAQAAEDADAALSLSGVQPLSISEISVPGFASANASNVLWANIIGETNDVAQTGIINWVSHMSTFYVDGYTSVGATRAINSTLYDEISSTDARKNWWLDETGYSPLLNASGYNAVLDELDFSDGYEYVNVKFGTGDGTITGTGAAAGDWILMRAEELILIKAEGLAKSGGDGAGVLASFVQTYRDPAYTVNQHGLSLEDEIWWQRRVELWGEGFAFNDIMRLNKPIVREGSANWATDLIQNISAGNGILLWRIPQPEIESNNGISEADNNPFVAY